MLRIIFGIFIVLHGLVHLLYFGQSARYFELQPGMLWPDGSWIFSSLLGGGTVRNLASAVLILAAIGFVAGGIGSIIRQEWWRLAVTGTAIFSTVIYILFWDGIAQALDNKGFIGILINIAILVVVLILKWPKA
jgi:hypothetical protein